MATGLLMSSIVIAGCAMTPTGRASRSLAMPSAIPPAITSVGVDPKTLHPGGQVTIRYELSQPANVRIDLVDDEGRVVRQLAAGRQIAGPQQIIWDGRADDGTAAPGGVYRYVIRAQNAEGHDTVYDPSRDTGGEELQPRDFTFDRAAGTLQWLMPRAGFARLRIGIEGFPHLRTLLDWEPMEAGRQSMVWDGSDQSGLLNVKDHPNLSIKLTLFAMPDNTVIVRGPRATTRSSQSPTYPPLTKREPAAYFHARHPRAVCHEVGFTIDFPEATQRNVDGHPIVAGQIPVRVILNERDASYLVNQRFEVVVYEGLTILFEAEEGTSPFNFLWDTSHLPPGLIVMTVNILSYDDHYGVATVPVVIERPGAST